MPSNRLKHASATHAIQDPVSRGYALCVSFTSRGKRVTETLSLSLSISVCQLSNFASPVTALQTPALKPERRVTLFNFVSGRANARKPSHILCVRLKRVRERSQPYQYLPVTQCVAKPARAHQSTYTDTGIIPFALTLYFHFYKSLLRTYVYA